MMLLVEDMGDLDVSDIIRLFGHEDHVRLFGKDYRKILEKMGLEVEVCSPNCDLRVEEIELNGFIEDDVI